MKTQHLLMLRFNEGNELSKPCVLGSVEFLKLTLSVTTRAVSY